MGGFQRDRPGRDRRRQARRIWGAGARFQVFDGGSDGVASTGPNTVFARQGIFFILKIGRGVRTGEPAAIRANIGAAG